MDIYRRKQWCFEQYFPMFYLSDMDDLDMTCGDFVHALKMLICSEKHPVSRANHGHTKRMVTDRRPTMWDFISSTIFSNFYI